MDYGQSCYKLLIHLLQAEMQRHCPDCLNHAMFLLGEIPAAEAGHHMKRETTVKITFYYIIDYR